MRKEVPTPEPRSTGAASGGPPTLGPARHGASGSRWTFRRPPSWGTSGSCSSTARARRTARERDPRTPVRSPWEPPAARSRLRPRRPRPAVPALERLLAWRLDVAHVNPSARTVMTSGGGDTTRYPAGAKVKLRTISGHRDTGITDCPGIILYAMLPGIRTRVATTGLPKLYNPRMSTSTIVSGEPVDISIRAKGSTPMTWSVRVLDASGGQAG